MGKLDLLQIEFADVVGNPHQVYRAGQMVNCNVRIKLNQPIKCRGIYVKITGESYVHWTEQKSSGSGKNRTTRTVHYRSSEKYIDVKVPIFTPPPSGVGAEHHPVGEFLYPIAFEIPAFAPSSFEGSVGRVRYQIQVNIDKPWKFDDHSSAYFTVLKDLDLNSKPLDLVGPFSTEDNFPVNCCYCCNCCGDVRVILHIPKRGYVPGESIPVQATITNTSKVDLTSIAFEIYQNIQYHAGGKTRHDTRVVSDTKVEGINKGSTKSFNDMLYVNPVPCSYLEGCNNIVINYFFRLYGDGGCCVALKKECCELVIGSVPLITGSIFAPQYPQAPGAVGFDNRYGQMQNVQPSAPPSGGVPPPPTYQECMFGRVDMKQDSSEEGGNTGRSVGGANTWAPVYPVFHAPVYPPEERKQ